MTRFFARVYRTLPLFLGLCTLGSVPLFSQGNWSVINPLSSLPARAELKETGPNAFTVTHEIIVPGTPEEIYDAFTAPDIRGWWDHTFSPKPVKLTIEPKAGGGFYEIFDEAGNGALHATVHYADRGKMLRFTGPLGLAGFAVTMAHTLEFTTVPPTAGEGPRTKVALTLNAFGALPPNMPTMVDGVWRHFLIEQFKPWIDAGKHKSATPAVIPAPAPVSTPAKVKGKN